MFTPALVSMLQKLVFMGISLSFLPPTIWALLQARDFSTLLSWPRLRAAWFGRFWEYVAPGVREIAEPAVVPLLQGRVSHGHILSAEEAEAARKSSTTSTAQQRPPPPASGTLLELGPGSGMWVSLFRPSNLPLVRKIYGVEPNAGVHAALRGAIAAAGLDADDTYEIVPVGIEDLAASGRVPRESVDCIVTVMCLCSIPEPEHNIAQLYGYLKPGGRWYVYEHVKCFAWQGRGISLYQSFLNLFWPHLIGGCQMRRDTAKYLREAGPWSDVDLCQLEGESWFYTMPHLIGVLTK